MHSRQVCNSDDVAEMLTSTGPVACLPSASHICYKSCSVLKLNHFLTRILDQFVSKFDDLRSLSSTSPDWHRHFDREPNQAFQSDVCVNRCLLWIHPSHVHILLMSVWIAAESGSIPPAGIGFLMTVWIAVWAGSIPFVSTVWIASSCGSIPLILNLFNICVNCCFQRINPSLR